MTVTLDPAAVDAPEYLDPPADGGAKVGCARVSTAGQLLDRQIAALTVAGCIRVVADKKSGKDVEREELSRALDYLRPGDTLVVASLDRLGRSLADLISIVTGLRRRGVGFASLDEALDASTSATAPSKATSPTASAARPSAAPASPTSPCCPWPSIYAPRR
ncbi:recombinase family protein [Kitasatospora sp. NPDC094011]|uniref:recombinase family protein n=1 Tax=Kitasatospora sp. NPDC094011 TaxID=3364090 RepID=UPI00380BC3D1